MSYRLTLYIPREPFIGTGSHPVVVNDYDQLTLDSEYIILGQLTDMIDRVPTSIHGRVLPLEVQIAVYGDEGVIETRFDAHGNELTFVFAEELKCRLLIPDNVSPRNRAIKAYLDALPNSTCIVLMWH